MSDRPTFEFGLVMAGAISAGAYTAGVLDFLLEALDAIADKRAGRDTPGLERGLPNENPVIDPPHQARLTAMSGTSAGAMVAAILATVLGTRIPPVANDRKPFDTSPTGNPLYDAWVLQIHQDRLLSTDDLDRGTPVRSLLDSSHLEEIVGEALGFSRREDYRRPYVGANVPIYLCVGNLRGVGYSLRVSGAAGSANEHQMSMHADWLGYCFDYDGKGARAGMLSLIPGGAPDNWRQLGTAALASGAFPIGLSARTIRRAFADYPERDWYDPSMLLDPVRRPVPGGFAVPVEEPSSWMSQAGGMRKIEPMPFADKHYEFVNVDGGVFNNEPLELCRVAVAGGRGRNPRDPREADRAVLMIDPFPNMFAQASGYMPEDRSQLLNVLKSLAGAFVSQARFKPDELALARDPQVASRYAIMPIRYPDRDPNAAPRDKNDPDPPETYAIACGSLGGFGGFLSQAFRHHDFMLGRRNCQRFLSNHFVLPADPDKKLENPLFAGWFAPEFPQQTRDRFTIDKPITVDGKEICARHLPIVPLLGKLADPSYTAMPKWPLNPRDLDMEKLGEAIGRRADAVKASLVAQLQPAWPLRAAMQGFWWYKRNEWIERLALDPVRADLGERGLLR